MIRIRHAHIGDVQHIHDLIYELAVYEKAPEQMVISVDDLAKDGFGDNPAFLCFVAEYDGIVAGMSFCYNRYSSWKGRVLYLEDLIVRETFRGKGIGKALFQYTQNYARSNNYIRVQWQVIDWNQPAIDFYKSFGAGMDPEWLNAWIEVG